MNRLRIAASLLLVSAGVTALVAAQLPALPSTAVADAPPTQPGSAFASAVVLAANPEYGGLSLVVRGDQSTASYTGVQTVANSQAVNLGYIGGLLNGPPNSCYGSTGGPSPTAAVNALEASSASGSSSTSADGGIETVSVNPSPELATATTSLSPIDIPGLVTLMADAASHVSYVGGQDQEADANTTMAVSLLGGLVTLNGLNWSAKQETGNTDVSTATFSMTSITVAGKTTNIANSAQVGPAIAVVNKVLATVGLTITQPALSTDAVTGTVAISPLRLQVVGTAVANTVLGALNPTETTLEQKIGTLLAAGSGACVKLLESYVGDAELIAGIVEGILAGGGVIDLDLGGANADTQAAPNFIDPLGTLGGSSSTGASGQLPSSLGTSSGSSGGSFGLGVGGANVSPVSPGGAATSASTPSNAPGSGTQQVALIHCVTSSPSGRPGCWSGAATVGAAALLALGGSLFVADIVRSRRRMVRPKETL